MWNSQERFKDYLKLKGLKERTIVTYIVEFNKFCRFQTLSVQNLYSYLGQPNNQYHKSRSFVKHLKDYLLLNRIEFNLSTEQIDEIHLFEVPKFTGRLKHRIPKVLTEEEVLNLEPHFKTEKEKLMLLLCFYCGLRLGELVNIRINAFNWKYWGEKPEEPGEVRVIGKGDKEGVAIVPNGLMKRVARHIRATPYKSSQSLIFEFMGAKKENRGRTFQKLLREAGIKAGLTGVEDGKPLKDEVINPHKLRHSYATYLLKDKKKDSKIIKEALRHSSISSTQIYLHLDKEDLKKELDF